MVHLKPQMPQNWRHEQSQGMVTCQIVCDCFQSWRCFTFYIDKTSSFFRLWCFIFVQWHG